MYLEDPFKVRLKENSEYFEFYGSVQEEIYFDAPVPYGMDIYIKTWVDAVHAGDRLTH